MKSHSYLRHFPLFVVPGTRWKNYKQLTKELITFLAGEMKDLFHRGIVTDRVVVTGSKRNLRWISKIACLTRGYENKGRVRAVHCCHQCLAGTSDCPAEDFSTDPCWLESIHLERPWSDQELPCLHEVPFDSDRPEWIYKNDVFHNLRLGVYRVFSASCIFLWARWGCLRPLQLVDDQCNRKDCSTALF